MGIRNLTNIFVADDTLREANEKINKIVKHAESLGAANVYVDMLFENPDAVKDEHKYFMASGYSVHVGPWRTWLLRIRKHILATIEAAGDE